MSKQEQTELTPEIWSKVLDYMTGENAPNLFRGIYDAANGNKKYMYGISTVMEFIAYHAGDDIYDKFSNEFTENMIASENITK